MLLRACTFGAGISGNSVMDGQFGCSRASLARSTG